MSDVIIFGIVEVEAHQFSMVWTLGQEIAYADMILFLQVETEQAGHRNKIVRSACCNWRERYSFDMSVEEYILHKLHRIFISVIWDLEEYRKAMETKKGRMAWAN